MPPTKKNKLIIVQKAMPRLWLAVPDVKKSTTPAIYITKAGPPPVPRAAMGAKPPKPPAAAMAPKPKAPGLPGLSSRGRAALDAVPLKSVESVNEEKDDEGEQ